MLATSRAYPRNDKVAADHRAFVAPGLVGRLIHRSRLQTNERLPHSPTSSLARGSAVMSRSSQPRQRRRSCRASVMASTITAGAVGSFVDHVDIVIAVDDSYRFAMFRESKG